MILVDTGPLVALFDPKDDSHERAKKILAHLSEPLLTTVPVLTEAFHLLGPSSRGARVLRSFVSGGGMAPWYLSHESLARAFELMDRYADHPMDLADASLVVAAEVTRALRVFTIDRNDFATYRARIGRGHRKFAVID